MSETLTVLEIDCSTGESITRPLTQEEINDRIAMQEAAAAREAELAALAEAKAAARASAETKLAALGLTPEEIAAL